MLKRLELSATAFESSSRPTSCIVRFWRAGRSKTTAMPVNIAIAYTSQTCTWPRIVIAASTAERAICTACVTIIVLRLSNRSATTPAKRPKSVNGPNRASESKPTATGEWVRLEDEPVERDVLHPRAADRGELPAEEEPVVAVAAQAGERSARGEADERHPPCLLEQPCERRDRGLDRGALFRA